QKAVVTAESVEQVTDDLRNIVQMQPFVFSDWPPLAGHRPREGLRAALDLRTARDVCSGECLRENILATLVESPNTKALLFALDNHGRIDHSQRVAAINWRNIYRFVEHTRASGIQALVERQRAEPLLRIIQQKRQAAQLPTTTPIDQSFFGGCEGEQIIEH